MAFTVQLPNTSKIIHSNWTDSEFLKSRRKLGASHKKNISFDRNGVAGSSMYSFAQKFGSVAPSLCFQSQVFYPNAIAAVKAMGDYDGEQRPQTAGCRGNQVQRDFPLEHRLPSAIPLVQYPSPVSKYFLDQLDICAAPVLNWEKYVELFRRGMEFSKIKDKSIPGIRKISVKQKKKNKRQKWSRMYAGIPVSERPPIEDISTSSSSEDECSENTSDEENEERDSKFPIVALERMKTLIKKKKRRRTRAKIKEQLFKDDPTDTKKRKKKLNSNDKPETSKNKSKGIKLGFLKKFYNKKRMRIPLTALGAIKAVPKLSLQATWNYVFGGQTGSCCIDANSSFAGNLTIYNSNQTQIRKIVLEKSNPASIGPYRVQSVWEENLVDVPTNKKPENALSDTVFQVQSPRMGRSNILGVRRGMSVDLYGTEDEAPYLLDSISNICYGTMEYSGWKRNIVNFAKSPLLLGFDFNPMYSAELVTIDENGQLRICDFTKGQTLTQEHISRPTRIGPKWLEYPKFRYINDASGVQFGHHGHIYYAWADSRVILGDRRDNSRSRRPFTDIFDLRRSTPSLSWSDQIVFNTPKVELHEYISCLKCSKVENYYYVGTTSRVFLMDVRVPDQPVLKMEHGMKDPITYLDTCADDAFEVLVGGSQRTGSTFSAITDYAHVKCYDRPGCKAVNPVMHCLPRHLSNSQEFFDTACSLGFELSGEAEFQRAKMHNYGWTTGLATCKLNRLMKNSHEPGGISIFTTNCFGDLFHQEWDQSPIEYHRKIQKKDLKFKEFLEAWNHSMKIDSKTEFVKPSFNPLEPVDYSLLIEPSAREIKRMTDVRSTSLNVIEQDPILQQKIDESQIPFNVKIKKLREYKADISQRCLDFWEYECDSDDQEATVKQETERELDMLFGNEWSEDGTRDVEYLATKHKGNNQEIINFSNPPSSSSDEEQNDPLSLTSDEASQNENIQFINLASTAGPSSEEQQEFQFQSQSQSKPLSMFDPYDDFFESSQKPVADEEFGTDFGSFSTMQISQRPKPGGSKKKSGF